MLKKLRLDQTKKYEQSIAVYETSLMLCAFVEGRKHILSIGAEQGDVKGWDDFIIQDSPNEFTHLQVKRQQTDFKPDGKSVKEKSIDLSPLDKSFQSLAQWVEKQSRSSINKHRFRIELPSDGVKIKEEIELRNLRDFLVLHIKDTTTVKGLEDLQNVAKDSNATNIFKWLTTWCGFKGWENILKALRLLEIRDNGSEIDIDNKSKTELARVFNDPSAVISKIKSYLDENTAYTGQIAPRQLLFELKGNLLTNCQSWTQIDGNGDEWEISGIHDLEDNSEIERPSKIVPELWANDKGRKLHINISPVNNVLAPIHEGVFQLALHLQGNSNGFCTDWAGWKICISDKVGLTLGDSEDDLEKLTISTNNTPYKINGGKRINSNAEREDFAKEIGIEMIKATWSMVVQKVSFIIGNMDISQSPELRDAVEKRWSIWMTSLENDVDTQKEIFRRIVHPNAEGQDILGHLRIGPKTKTLLADALFICILVSVGLDPENSGIMRTKDGGTIGAIGINHWSGPAGKKRRVREIDDEDSVEELIGKDPSDILILSKSRQVENLIYKQPLTEFTNVDHSLAAPRRPKLLVTRNPILNATIKKGSISDLRTYLERDLFARSESINETLNNLS
ncbi:MAG: hypothetical protein J0H74_15670 [Chitinophagaceae bacterium]|nr:hypothetical protein [Chitinophagaceae bacterium]